MEDKGTPVELTPEELGKVTGGREMVEEELLALDAFQKKVEDLYCKGSLSDYNLARLRLIIDTEYPLYLVENKFPFPFTIDKYIEMRHLSYLLE